MAIRPAAADDVAAILDIINDGAQAYRDVIPADRWHDPYMPREHLAAEIEAGVRFWLADDDDGRVSGVMGIQPVQDVTLIRHAYVRTALRRGGVGSALLRFLLARAQTPVLIGTWAAADWAVAFYQKHGFREVDAATKTRLLETYWSIPARQVETSVVLADAGWWSLN